MKIRRYLGSNTQEAILKVKMDLGNEALILNTRKVRQKGLFKIFAKPMVEVLAAIDEDYAAKKELQVSKQEMKTKGAEKIIEKEIVVSTKKDENVEKISELENKVSNMESLLQKVYEQFLSSNNRVSPVEQEKQQDISGVLKLFYDNLIKNEVENEIVKRIIDMVNEKKIENSSVNETASLLHNIISSMLGKPETIQMKEEGKPTVVIFLGPTGVGKTTTLAKIAANYALNHKKKVGLITADTYRIAAVEQLKTYAEILGMPVTVIYTAAEIKEAINQYADKDIILVDTAGRSHRNKAQFDELKSLVAATEADEAYLVLSTTTSFRNCREILSNYDFLKDYKLIFTKVDETPIMGIVLNTRYLTNKKISYITTGQSVPDDIEVANIDKITKNLLGSIT